MYKIMSEKVSWLMYFGIHSWSKMQNEFMTVYILIEKAIKLKNFK